MIIRWSQRFPAEAMPPIQATLERLGKLWAFDDYEIDVNLRASSREYGWVWANPKTRTAELRLHRKRIVDLERLERDLFHELLHIPLWGYQEAFEQVMEFVPPPARRKADRIARATYESAHNTMSELWRRALSAKAGGEGLC